MTLCERCGSTSIAKAHPRTTDQLIALLTRRRLFLCHRCGWRGRRHWSDADLEKLREYGAGGAEPDPSLASLDGASAKRRKRKRRRNKARSAASGNRVKPRPAEFDIDRVDLSADVAVGLSESAPPAEQLVSSGQRRSVHRRRRRYLRNEIIATIAVSALTISMVVLISLSGSCSGPTNP